MAHPDLGESGPDAPKGAHHLDADDTCSRAQIHLLQHTPVDEAEIAVGVTHMKTEQQLHPVVIGAADHLAIPRITSADLVTLHHIGVSANGIDAPDDLGCVVLGVAIGVKTHSLVEAANPDSNAPP